MKSALIMVFMFFIIFSLSFAQIPKSAYVVNTLGESLSKINLENQTVLQPPKSLDLYANDIKISGEQAYVVISGSNEIRIFDLSPFTDVGSIQLGNGTNPYAIDFVDDSTAVVSLLLTNQVVFINVASRQVVRTVNVGTGPQGVLYFQGNVYVANSGFNGAGFDPGKVSVIELDHYSVSHIPVGINPQSLDVDNHGNIIVACSGDYVSVDGQMDVIEPQLGMVTFSVPINQPVTTVEVNQQNLAFLATYSSGVMVYDLSQKVFIRDESEALKGGPAVDFDQDDNIYIGHFDLDSVYVYDPNFQKIEAYLVGDGPVSLAVFDPKFSSLSASKSITNNGYELFNNYPNPFNPRTQIKFRLPVRSDVKIEILNSCGQIIKRLLQGELAAGDHTFSWDGRNDFGKRVASGIYFCRMKTSAFEQVKSMHYVK
jgi:hypothetical protein